jgi:hypothetical protein
VPVSLQKPGAMSLSLVESVAKSSVTHTLSTDSKTLQGSLRGKGEPNAPEAYQPTGISGPPPSHT